MKRLNHLKTSGAVCALCFLATVLAHAQAFETLVNFNGTNGYEPVGGLFQATDGNFYGTTGGGGAVSSLCPYGCGTIFRMTPTGALTCTTSTLRMERRLPLRWSRTLMGTFMGRRSEVGCSRPVL
jgi:uncharacterized repeat protein (TIGR03803 family)